MISIKSGVSNVKGKLEHWLGGKCTTPPIKEALRRNISIDLVASDSSLTLCIPDASCPIANIEKVYL